MCSGSFAFELHVDCIGMFAGSMLSFFKLMCVVFLSGAHASCKRRPDAVGVAGNLWANAILYSLDDVHLHAVLQFLQSQSYSWHVGMKESLRPHRDTCLKWPVVVKGWHSMYTKNCKAEKWDIKRDYESHGTSRNPDRSGG